ncbi:hypothetical protein ACIBQ6_00180 [Nonomuraea sp. NPDC049655]|uniref:hypothetical protein n=1 Tax=Nonomuraea sp. NPDC049655 TaxID=3364355 RepID=UPI0037AF938B
MSREFTILQAVGTHPAVTATKSMTGHMCGAAGAMGAVAAILSMRDGLIPATRNLEALDPRITLDVVAGGPRSGHWTTALVNAFGFGGHNTSLVFAAA